MRIVSYPVVNAFFSYPVVDAQRWDASLREVERTENACSCAGTGPTVGICARVTGVDGKRIGVMFIGSELAPLEGLQYLRAS